MTPIFEVFEPASSASFAPELKRAPWLYRYTDSNRGWVLAIATCGEPRSGSLSLGGFRIVPLARAQAPGFSVESEAMRLAIGMEGKVAWSRMLGISGPRGKEYLSKIVGGKCVLLPSPGSRVGEPLDKQLLDFGLECMRHFEETSGIYLTTGEDLGHGMLSGGSDNSLSYMHRRFRGCVVSDTSLPTAEGNYYMLKGMYAGFGHKLAETRTALIGCGNIGMRLLQRLVESGAGAAALDSKPERLMLAKQIGAKICENGRIEDLLSDDIDGLCVNAFAGSLNPALFAVLKGRKKIKLVCGCENLAVAMDNLDSKLRGLRILYCPTELCGMMGYLTAVEEYIDRRDGFEFKLESMFEAAAGLERIGNEATARAISLNYAKTFEECVREIYS